MKCLKMVRVLLIVAIFAVSCDSAALNSKQDSKCGVNAIYLECGNNCRPSYCKQTLEEFKNCTLSCVSGCFCMPGFVKLAPEDIECVPDNLCTKEHTPTCGPNEIYLEECQWGCVKSCFRLGDFDCEKWCVKGCVCEPGYVRALNSHNSSCILPSQCPQF